MPTRSLHDDQRVHPNSPAAPDAVEDLRTYVTVSRTHADDAKQRQVVATIDGDHKTTLLYGDSVTIEVRAGAHRLRAHNTLVWKTVRFTVEPGEHLEFTVINRIPGWAFAMLSLLGAGPMFIEIRQRSLL